ncbi:MAG: acylglycerol lipase [Pseudonocardiales bacterium]|nr:acylglycerol lipase [Pseudonocardiales bacterium]
MEHRGSEFSGAGGVRIYWQSWLPHGEPRAVIVLAHGASEHSGRYDWTASQLVAAGYAVYALDHRGHGKSDGPRAVIDRMDNAVADVGTLIDIAAGEQPGSGRPLLFGHSMGGCISLAFATRRQDEIDALILSAPLAALEAASPAQRIAGHLLSVIAPKLGVFPIDSATVSRDPAVVAAYDADPLNYHGKLPARTVHELATEIGRFPESIQSLTLPLLVMVGTGDTLVPPAAADLVYEKASSEDKTIKRYDGLYHELVQEPERDQVLADLTGWLGAHARAAAV